MPTAALNRLRASDRFCTGAVPVKTPDVRRDIDWSFPDNGAVAVTQNRRTHSPQEAGGPLQELGAACERAAAIVGARAVIRIDCRQDRAGAWKLFDLNMKPNMTGPGRPGRDDQDSLTAIAARAMGWDYSDLILNLLSQAWTATSY